MDRTPEIFAFIASQSTRHQLPGSWFKIPAAKAYFVTPKKPAALLSALRAKFAVAELVAAGVVQVGANEKVTLAPALAKGSRLLRQIHSEAKGPPVHLVVDGQCLPNKWAFSILLQSRRLVELARDADQTILVTGTAEDAAVLDACDLPAVHSASMNCFNSGGVDRFCTLLKVPRRPPSAASNQSRFASTTPATKIVVVAWSPAELTADAVPQAEAIVTHLRRLHGSLRIPITDSKVWRPPANFLIRLDECLRYGDREDVQTALRDSLQRHCQYLISDTAAGRPKPKTYAQQHAEWLACRDPLLGGYDRQKNVQQMIRLQHQELIAPLLAEAARQQSPKNRNLYSVLAHLCAVLHRQSLDLLLRCNSDTGSPVPGKEELEQWLQLSTHVRETIQELGPRTRRVRK